MKPIEKNTFETVYDRFLQTEQSFFESSPITRRIRKIRNRIAWALFTWFLVSIVLCFCRIGWILPTLSFIAVAVTVFLFIRNDPYEENQKRLRQSKDYHKVLRPYLWELLSVHINLDDPKAVTQACMEAHKASYYGEFVLLSRMLELLGIKIDVEHPTSRKPLVQHIFTCGGEQSFYETEVEFEY